MARVEIILDVISVEETVEWYTRVLGWKGGYDVFDKDNNCLFGEVYTLTPNSEESQNHIGFNLARSDPSTISGYGCSWQALIYVDDVEAMYRRVLEKGWSIMVGLENQPWGGRTFKMVDLNGVRLTFAQMIESPSIEEIQSRIDTH